MLRRMLVVLTAATVAASASSDVSACGDKFLRAGRSARSRNYAAVHRASILIYKPTATAEGLKEFESLLRKAGHKTVALKDGTLLSKTLTSTRYDVVIADYADTPTIRSQMAAMSGQPGLLPVLHNPSKAQVAKVAKEYHCLIMPEKMTKYDALDEIDHFMELRLKGGAAPAPAR